MTDPSPPGPGDAAASKRAALLREEQERFGGIQLDAVFFGWLTTIGMVILLSVLTGVSGAVAGVAERTDLARALETPATNRNNGLIGGIIMLAVLTLSYFAGGYVAGRMARSKGLKQGFAVWLWAFAGSAIQIILILALRLDQDYESLQQLNALLPLLPQPMDGFVRGKWIAVPAGLAAALVGACLGGLAGTHRHVLTAPR